MSKLGAFLKIPTCKNCDICAYFVCSLTHEPSLERLQGTLSVLGACVGPLSSLKGACGVAYGVKRGVSLVGRAGDTILCVFPFLPLGQQLRAVYY